MNKPQKSYSFYLAHSYVQSAEDHFTKKVILVECINVPFFESILVYLNTNCRSLC